MYLILGYHLWISLILRESLRGALLVFGVITLIYILLQQSVRKLQVGTYNRAQKKTNMYITNGLEITSVEELQVSTTVWVKRHKPKVLCCKGGPFAL